MTKRVDKLFAELKTAIREEAAALPPEVGTLADEIVIARTRGKMSLQDVADAAGFSKAHIHALEKKASTNPTVHMLVGLSLALDVPFLRLAQAALNQLHETTN